MRGEKGRCREGKVRREEGEGESGGRGMVRGEEGEGRGGRGEIRNMNRESLDAKCT